MLFYELSARNHARAAEWLEKAAQQGSAVAQYNLAVDFSTEGDFQYDLQKAKYWATKAAYNGEKTDHRLLQKLIELEESKNSK